MTSDYPWADYLLVFAATTLPLLQTGDYVDEKKDQKDHPVGYKNPPRHSQFKPGQSGNPKGRPKKDLTLPEILSKEMKTRVPIVRNGKKSTISMLDAIVKRLATDAANGDPKVAALLFRLLTSEPFTSGDPLTDLVQEFRALHAQNKLNEAKQDGDR